MESPENNSFSDDFCENKSQLIRLNSPNIRREFCRRSQIIQFPWFPPKKFRIPGLSRAFQDFYGVVNNIFFFLQNKTIHPVVYINNSSFYSKNKNKISFEIYYILLYRSFTPEN